MRKGLGLYVSSDAVLEKGFWDWIKKQGKSLFSLQPTKKQLKQMRSQKPPSQQSKHFTRAQQRLSDKLSPKKDVRSKGKGKGKTKVAAKDVHQPVHILNFPTKREMAHARKTHRQKQLHRKLKKVNPAPAIAEEEIETTKEVAMPSRTRVKDKN